MTTTPPGRFVPKLMVMIGIVFVIAGGLILVSPGFLVMADDFSRQLLAIVLIVTGCVDFVMAYWLAGKMRDDAK